MPGLLGAEYVQLDLQQAMLFGKVISSGVVKTRTSTDTLTSTTFANVYVGPITEISAIGQGGSPNRDVLAYIWRIGETTDVTPDCQLIIGAVTYLITNVYRRMDADIDNNFCLYDCRLAAVA